MGRSSNLPSRSIVRNFSRVLLLFVSLAEAPSAAVLECVCSPAEMAADAASVADKTGSLVALVLMSLLSALPLAAAQVSVFTAFLSDETSTPNTLNGSTKPFDSAFACPAADCFVFSLPGSKRSNNSSSTRS